jgi:hypothetical protein
LTGAARHGYSPLGPDKAAFVQETTVRLDMQRIIAAAAVAFVLAGLTACAKYNFGSLGPQENVVLLLRMDTATNTCKLQERTPPELRASSGRTVRWMFIGSCGANTTIGISQQLTRDGRGFDAFDITHQDTRLSEKAPADPSTPLVLSARLRDGLEKGHYRYTVLINGMPAEYNSRADDGSFFICPRWPCGGFSDY